MDDVLAGGVEGADRDDRARMIPKWRRYVRFWGADPAASLEAVERRVQRSFLDLQDVVGDLLEPARNGVAVHGAPAQRLENENVERALEQVDCGFAHDDFPIEILWERMACFP